MEMLKQLFSHIPSCILSKFSVELQSPLLDVFANYSVCDPYALFPYCCDQMKFMSMQWTSEDVPT